MRTIQLATLLSTVALLMSFQPAYGQAERSARSANLSKADRADLKASSSASRSGVDKAKAAGKPVVQGLRDRLDQAERTDPSLIRRLLEDFKAAQKKFLDEQKQLQKQWKDAPAAQRETIRGQLRDKRDAFLEQQKEMREEIRKRVDELKSQLPEHSDVIEDAREQAVEHRKDKQRRGGAD
jgi:hypothetical protein